MRFLPRLRDLAYQLWADFVFTEGVRQPIYWQRRSHNSVDAMRGRRTIEAEIALMLKSALLADLKTPATSEISPLLTRRRRFRFHQQP